MDKQTDLGVCNSYLDHLLIVFLCFQSFKGIAKVLGTAISEREDLRMDVMASLRKLLNQSKQNGRYSSQETCPALTFTTLWENLADDKLMIVFLFFPENRI